MDTLTLSNNQAVPLKSIPVAAYDDFLEINTSLLMSPDSHCVNYFGFMEGGMLKLICCIAMDADACIEVSSSMVSPDAVLPSFTNRHLSFHIFERELNENFGLGYADHPWLKPVRFGKGSANELLGMANYPFYGFDGDELHEVGVGPIHAGVIEPGHFRFLCNGEQILHLEIQLGYQHRGIEKLFLEKKKLLQRTLLAESIAGDTVAGHTTAFASAWEALCGFHPSGDIQYSRFLAQELERIAIHTGDLSALCTDVAYQLGSAVFGRLRTPVINFSQRWCGNRLAKGLIRPGRDQYPFTAELAKELRKVLDKFEPDIKEISHLAFSLPTVLTRFEKTGVVTTEQTASIGAVGMSARMAGVPRDIRKSHPYGLYANINHQPIIKHHGDVYSRVQIRREEVNQSIGYIREMLDHIPEKPVRSPELKDPRPDSFVVSLTEGWRGEICHCAVTDSRGDLLHYKIKDPSLHNWLALALSVRNNEISDFPICNKSFNLSYCGHDL